MHTENLVSVQTLSSTQPCQHMHMNISYQQISLLGIKLSKTIALLGATGLLLRLLQGNTANPGIVWCLQIIKYI